MKDPTTTPSSGQSLHEPTRLAPLGVRRGLPRGVTPPHQLGRYVEAGLDVDASGFSEARILSRTGFAYSSSSARITRATVAHRTTHLRWDAAPDRVVGWDSKSYTHSSGHYRATMGQETSRHGLGRAGTGCERHLW